MTEIGKAYGESLYALAREEGLHRVIYRQLQALGDSFAAEPGFLRLLSAPGFSRAERCRILDDCFRGKIEPDLLNFLKILTGKGYLRHFPDCLMAYRELYNRDNGILRVTAVTAVPMTGKQAKALTGKLRQITGKRITLITKLDPSVLGGVRLDYDGMRVDGTLAHRLDAVRTMLHNTML